MRAIRVERLGGPEVLTLAEVPPPEPGPGEVRIKVAAAGVNFIDVYHRSGLYPLTVPFIPGSEAAGVVDAVGAGVAEFRPGDRVAHAMQLGSYAEYQVVPARNLVSVPPEVSLEDAAAIMLQGMTAHYLATSTFSLHPGHRALVHAAAGGVGLLLVQIAKMRGATVYGTVSTEEKARLAREAGADEVILYTRTDFETEVRRLTGGEGVDVVYDSVGRATFEASMRCLKPRGYLVLYGQSSGPVPPLDPQVLNQRGSLFLTRPSLGHYIARREELLARAGDLFGWLRDGKLRLRVDRTFPLDEAAEAHRLLEGRGSAGKLLLIP
ncbi:MAG: quinone oxidoreductase [Firmicutes bacterium]|nr:quinone oxidoreductase [Bacillota bacterium]